jgi:hypothetical protein
MKLKPLDPNRLLKIAQADHLRALAITESRLHRAMLIMSTQPPVTPGGSFSILPEYRGDWWDEGFEGSRLSDADICRRIEAWGRKVPAPEPGEIDQAERILDLLAGHPSSRRFFRVIQVRAWQEHNDRESWRRAGRMLGVSHVTAARLHLDAVQHALTRSLEGVCNVQRVAA